MHFNFEIVKKHPYIIGGIALVVFIYIYLKDSASNSSGAVVASSASNTSLQQAELNAATQLQMAQVQANAQVQTLNAQSAAQAQQTQAAIELAKIQAGVQNNQTVAQQNIAENSNATTQAIQVGAQQAQVSIAGMADQTQQALASYAAQTAQQQIQSSTQLGELQYLAPIAEENIAAGVEENQIQADENYRTSTIAQAVALQAAGKGGGGVINNLIGAANGATGLEAVQSTNFANNYEGASIAKTITGGVSNVLGHLFG